MSKARYPLQKMSRGQIEVLRKVKQQFSIREEVKIGGAANLGLKKRGFYMQEW